MKTLKQIAFALPLSLLVSVPVFAAPAGSHPERGSVPLVRVEREKHHGHQDPEARQAIGKQSGALLREQREIRDLARIFFEDGRLSQRERQILEYRIARVGDPHRGFRRNGLERYLKLHDEYGHY